VKGFIMNVRRNFLKHFGLLGAAIGGAASAKIVIEEEKKSVNDISHLAPDDSPTLVLQGNRKPNPQESQYPGYVLTFPQEYQNEVHLSVGKDNRLWIKSDNVWKIISVD
jgi:hypothetical protein